MAKEHEVPEGKVVHFVSCRADMEAECSAGMQLALHVCRAHVAEEAETQAETGEKPSGREVST